MHHAKDVMQTHEYGCLRMKRPEVLVSLGLVYEDRKGNPKKRLRNISVSDVEKGSIGEGCTEILTYK